MIHPFTEARLRRIAAERAHNRRTQGLTDGGPHLRAGRLEAVFPGFPPLAPAYEAPNPPRPDAWWLAASRDITTETL